MPSESRDERPWPVAPSTRVDGPSRTEGSGHISCRAGRDPRTCRPTQKVIRSRAPDPFWVDQDRERPDPPQHIPSGRPTRPPRGTSRSTSAWLRSGLRERASAADRDSASATPPRISRMPRIAPDRRAGARACRHRAAASPVRCTNSGSVCHSACQPPTPRSCSCGIAASIVATSPGARTAAAIAMTARTGFRLCGIDDEPPRRPPESSFGRLRSARETQIPADFSE